MDRRDFLKSVGVMAAGALLAQKLPGGIGPLAQGAEPGAAAGASPTVYMTTAITPAGLMAAFKALDRPLGRKVAVKLSMGEPGGHYYLAPDLVKALVQSVNGTFVDCNTAYGGKRGTVADHLQTARDHGFAAIAPVDIMDAEGDLRLPVAGGKHLKEVRVGSHYANYDSMLSLAHFKGHAMGGFGGSLKNLSIGIASRAGKCLVHTAGRSATNPFDGPDKQEDFLESMAEATEGMVRAMKGNILYINVMNNLSVDCDCSSSPARPELADIGILSSLDPVALDRACVDLVYAADAKESAPLRQRIESRKGTLILDHAEKLGIGKQRYTLTRIA